MVFDNADNLDEQSLSAFFPTGPTGNLIISSRNSSLTRIVSVGASLEVKAMDLPSSSVLLRTSAHLEFSREHDQAIIDICNELYHIPLALDQAGALIRNGICTIYDFEDMYKKHRNSLMRDDHFKGASQYGSAIYATWDLSYEELTKRAALGTSGAQTALLLLRLFASFHHTNISEDLLGRAAECTFNFTGIDLNGNCLSQPEELVNVLQIDNDGFWDNLQAFSLVLSSPELRTYSLHPLIHAWCVERQTTEEKIAS